MNEQSAPQRRESITTPLKLIAANVLLNRRNEIQNMIAHRAYELFEGHGSVHGHDFDDWIEAEDDVVRGCRHDLKESAESITFHAELPCTFEAEQLNVSVEPRRLMVSGERDLDVTCVGETPTHVEKRTQRIFAAEELPMDVNPTRATAMLKGETLEIVMPKIAADGKSSGTSKVAAAAR